MFSSSLLGSPMNLSLLNSDFMLWYFSWMTLHFLLHISMSVFNLELFLVSSNIFFSNFFLSLSVILFCASCWLAVFLG